MAFMRGSHWNVLRRGDIRLLILDLLRNGPFHGYELAKQITTLSGGMYEPSPGVIYPTLQWLEDEGYVSISVQRGKKVYRVTEKALTLLEQEHESLDRMKGLIKEMAQGKRMDLIRAGMRLRQTLMLLHEEMTDKKAEQARLILDEARERLSGLLE